MIENRLLFFPDTELFALPGQFGLDHEDLWLHTTDGGKIHGWYLTPPPDIQPRAYLLFSHGNAGNISGRLPLADELVQRGLAVLMYDYRGYGQSPGEPTVRGVYSDAEAALAELVQRAGDPRRVVLFGRSLGGGVSWEMAVRHPELAGIITDCSFTSVTDMAGEVFPLSLLAPMVTYPMNNRRKVATATLPKLLLHGTDDEVIPFSMGEELAAAAAEPAEFVPIPGARHNDTYIVDPDLYFGAIEAFVERVVETQ